MSKFLNAITSLMEEIAHRTEWINDIESGNVRHFEGRDSQRMVDVTDERLERYKQDKSRFSEIVAAYKRREGDDA